MRKAYSKAAECTEPAPTGIKQHLMEVQPIGFDQKNPAMRQLALLNLQLCQPAAERGIILAQIELKRRARLPAALAADQVRDVKFPADL